MNTDVGVAEIEERLPVWQVLSEFFLDTELQPEDYERIARVLAASRYTIEKLEDILVCEVCPVCRWNMLSPAGEWVGFDADWLKQKLAVRYEKRLLFRKFSEFRTRWMYESHWNVVKARTFEIRAVRP